jgi:hypothetical protein
LAPNSGKSTGRGGSRVRPNSINFTARQLASIIRNCKLNDVEFLEIEGLKLKFSPTNFQDRTEQVFVGDDLEEIPGMNLFDENEDNPEVKKELEKDPTLDELRLQNLMMEDPAAYEREMERRITDA